MSIYSCILGCREGIQQVVTYEAVWLNQLLPQSFCHWYWMRHLVTWPEFLLTGRLSFALVNQGWHLLLGQFPRLGLVPCLKSSLLVVEPWLWRRKHYHDLQLTRHECHHRDLHRFVGKCTDRFHCRLDCILYCLGCSSTKEGWTLFNSHRGAYQYPSQALTLWLFLCLILQVHLMTHVPLGRCWLCLLSRIW